MQASPDSFHDLNIDNSIQRIDSLLQSNPPDNLEKLGFALGVRLAFTMASEIKKGIPLGTDSGKVIAGWVQTHGEAPAELAVQTARDFLTRPQVLKAELEKLLFKK